MITESPVLFLHAHPDDETLATGALIARLAAEGVEVQLVTATRGERGEVVPGSIDAAPGSPALARHRETELARALRLLGVARHAFLGGDRRYVDSGMRWVRPGWAGPDDGAGPDSLCRSPRAEQVADLIAVIDAWRPRVLVSYDAAGGYGHPDHVRCHEIAAGAALATGLPLLQVATTPDPTALLDLSAERASVVTALRAYRSQLTVHGDEVEHVGGQREAIITDVQLVPWVGA